MPPPTPPMPHTLNRHACFILRTWAELEAGIDRIMTEMSEGIDMKTYMGLYIAIDNFCTNWKASIRTRDDAYIPHSRRRALCLGEDLFRQYIECLKLHLAQFHLMFTMYADTDEQVLLCYIKQWDSYSTISKRGIHSIRLLKRIWTQYQTEDTIFNIYTLHVAEWKSSFFPQIRKNVMESVLRLVEKEREGAAIKHHLIKGVVGAFVDLRWNASDNTLDVYNKFFEKPFLEATADYYRGYLPSFADSSLVYFMEVEAILQKEQDRASLYLLDKSMGPLVETCATVLIGDRFQDLCEDFHLLLEEDRIDDLARIYKLLAKIPEQDRKTFRILFENHVHEAGLSAIEMVATNNPEAKDDVDLKGYVEALFQVHTHYHDLVHQSFADEPGFVHSLNRACRKYVNRNDLSNPGSKSAELLAKYADKLLKKSAASTFGDEMEKKLMQIVTIFQYLEDKDIFQDFYARRLAKRLINNSTSDDAETFMVSKLKDVCSSDYINKLQHMLQDMWTSAELNASFKERAREYSPDDGDGKTAVNAQYQILSTNFWPLKPPTTPFAPPQVIAECNKRFNAFYTGKYSGRKLNYLWQLCKGELRANYLKNSGGRALPIFQLSAYQMAILLLFNDTDTDTLAYDHIKQGTKLDEETIHSSIAVLLRAKVLTTPENSKPEPGTAFTLNCGFKTKRAKVNLNMGVQSDQHQQEVEDTYKTVEKDRKLLLQSTVVRIMKSKKKMKYQQLVGETISKIRTRFRPETTDIKKCIDILVEKEYLEYLEGEEGLGYVA